MFDFTKFISVIKLLNWISLRSSDRVCGTTKFGQTGTIIQNFYKSTKSCKIGKYLLKKLSKTGISIEY